MAKRDTPPTMVSAVICRSRGGLREVLIGKLPSPPHAGKWTFPAGPVEPGTPPEAALRQTLHTLLGMNVQITCGQPPFDHPWDQTVHRWRYYFCEAAGDELQNHYFAEVRWVPRAGLREYEFDPVSHQVVDWLLGENQA